MAREAELFLQRDAEELAALRKIYVAFAEIRAGYASRLPLPLLLMRVNNLGQEIERYEEWERRKG